MALNNNKQKTLDSHRGCTLCATCLLCGRKGLCTIAGFLFYVSRDQGMLLCARLGQRMATHFRRFIGYTKDRANFFVSCTRIVKLALQKTKRLLKLTT
ncbi:uncharacterized protein LOC117570491 isoform X2 [Drosophila albomicans]|uniref:Uncharacterized protein LOC117570491 isoform X2 n=1 Tax=Drosophila albomicans TaxID=7291 RepID=A0A9C6W6P1_DROAB|nr:uncharacterized protein LOC117570491 isoform X2 [Drosophila albomicans]